MSETQDLYPFDVKKHLEFTFERLKNVDEFIHSNLKVKSYGEMIKGFEEMLIIYTYIAGEVELMDEKQKYEYLTGFTKILCDAWKSEMFQSKVFKINPGQMLRGIKELK